MASQYTQNPDTCWNLAFECSQCGLCTAVCPSHLDPASMFLKWRQEAVSAGKVDLSVYKGILRYERTGCSQLFSFYSLPQDCHTVFFPGCTLVGTRPGVTLKAYDYLARRIPNTGIVLDCCTKPSHDIGRMDFFDAMFSEMIRFLTKNQITTIVTACPSCHKIFDTKSSLRVRSIYEIMAEDTKFMKETMTAPMAPALVQDPCQSRHDLSTQDAVRTLASRLGIDIAASRQSRTTTLCCGEGASVGCVSPETAGAWTKKRQAAAKGKNTLTYCAGCVNRLSGPGKNYHILDLVFDRETSLKKGAKVYRSPLTYMNRLKLKRKLAALPGRVTREREFFHGTGQGLFPALKKQVIFTLIIGITGLIGIYFI